MFSNIISRKIISFIPFFTLGANKKINVNNVFSLLFLLDEPEHIFQYVLNKNNEAFTK